MQLHFESSAPSILQEKIKKNVEKLWKGINKEMEAALQGEEKGEKNGRG